nr:nucleotidyltransferase [uncultured Sellimonas sp.]
MKIVGLIAEYNPFHNGHEYHIKKAKEITGADAVIVIMSGNFVQRGVPAIMPKHLRAKVALKAGASLVLELPVCYATGSAEYFAKGAVSLLDHLGCVDFLCFGSECGDIETLFHIASVLADEPYEYRKLLQASLRRGNSFPAARQEALCSYLEDPSLACVLSSPNNTLGIEYIKALLQLKSSIKPLTILRKDSSYHDSELEESGKYSSATAIRRLLLYAGNSFHTNEEVLYDEPKLSSVLARLEDHVPKECISLLERTHLSRYPVYSNDFSLLLKYRLMQETRGTLTRYADVSEELSNRIMKHLNDFLNFDQFCDLLKTKEVTYTRISRALLHIILGIKKSHMEDLEFYGLVHYARMLGFSKKDKQLLSQIKQNSSIPLIPKLTDMDSLSEHGQQMLHLDVTSSNLYESVITDKFKTPFCNEYTHPLVIV